MDSAFAALLGIHDDVEEVFIQLIEEVPSARCVYVDPLTANDWEVIEQFPAVLEDSAFLDQVAVVCPGQPILISLFNQWDIRLRVDKVEGDRYDSNCYFIGQDCEIAVVPRKREARHVFLTEALVRCKLLDNAGQFEDYFTGNLNLNENCEYLVSRICKYGRMGSEKMVMRFKYDGNVPEDFIKLPQHVFDTMALIVNEIVSVKVQNIDNAGIPVDTVEVSSNLSEKQALQRLRLFIKGADSGLIVNTGTTIRFPGNALIKFDFKGLEFCFMKNLQHASLKWKDYNEFPSCFDDIIDDVTLSIHNDLVDRIVDFMQLNIECNNGGMVAITGARRSGKSTILNNAILKLRNGGYVVRRLGYPLVKGDNFDIMLSDLLLHKGKSLLVIDDLDNIFPVLKPENPTFTAVSEKLAESLKIHHNIIILCATASLVDVDSSILSEHGVLAKFQIQPLTVSKRADLLKSFVLDLEEEIENFTKLFKLTEGFNVGDFQKLLTKTMLESKSSEHSTENVLRSLESFSPSHVSGTKLEQAQVKWSEVGGMFVAKELARKAIEWPVKYSELYRQSRLPSKQGILLYGMPGCGKTFLAKAIAAEANLKLIVVQGPEIMNKYIGESESAVRKIFEEARSMKPALILFDEFDSVALRRGEDSAGLTDRIVNQLLTELDGASELENIYVIATTTHPEKIDPALLRPGRLDQHVYCTVPSFEERKDIILKYMSNIFGEINEDITEKLCEQTDGWTPADISVFFANAELIMQKEVQKDHKEESSANFGNTGKGAFLNEVVVLNGDLDNELSEELRTLLLTEESIEQEDMKDKKSVLTWCLMEEALKESRATFSSKEIATFDKKFQLFQEGRKENKTEKTTFA
ncbi:hypothetical protein MP638_002446 [Amoeboaphelidium occidentale]|nr:hypothetical protein MP638_002446 [Amoeboaphelidium occidentale]